MRFTRTIAVIFLVVLIAAGCSTTFTYNRLDWLIPWYVDGYVDLTREQRQLLRERLEPTLQWHREEELARYLETLDGIESDLAGPVSAVQVSRWVEVILEAAERIEQSMMTVALDFGSNISDPQMDEFIEKLWEQQQEYEEEFLTRDDEEFRRHNYENLVDFMQEYQGRLTEPQKTILADAARSMLRFDSAWLEERASLLKTLEPLLRRQSGWQDAVQLAYSEREDKRTPEYQAILENNMEVVTGAIAQVLNLASEQQRDKALNEIEDWRRKIRKLIGSDQDADESVAGRAGDKTNGRAQPDFGDRLSFNHDCQTTGNMIHGG